jgi:hypothetical protein
MAYVPVEIPGQVNAIAGRFPNAIPGESVQDAGMMMNDDSAVSPNRTYCPGSLQCLPEAIQ